MAEAARSERLVDREKGFCDHAVVGERKTPALGERSELRPLLDRELVARQMGETPAAALALGEGGGLCARVRWRLLREPEDEVRRDPRDVRCERGVDRDEGAGGVVEPPEEAELLRVERLRSDRESVHSDPGHCVGALAIERRRIALDRHF